MDIPSLATLALSLSPAQRRLAVLPFRDLTPRALETPSDAQLLRLINALNAEGRAGLLWLEIVRVLAITDLNH